MNKANVPDFALSDESKQVIKDILNSKTAETNGVLNVDELGDCLEAFGFNADDEDVDFLKKHLDENGDGELEVDELVENIDVLNWHCFHGKDLMKEFLSIDSDGDGVIRYPEMLRVLTTRGPSPLAAMEARRLLDILARKFDANFDGKFSYAEFVKIYMSDALPYKNTLGQSHSSEDEGREPKAAAASPKKRPVKKKSTSGSLAVPASGTRTSSGSSSRSSVKSQAASTSPKATAPPKRRTSTTGTTTKSPKSAGKDGPSKLQHRRSNEPK